MADVKISALPAAAAALGADEIPVNEAGTTKKVTVDQILALIPTGLETKSGVALIGDFSGTPLKATVTFGASFSGAYSVPIPSSEDARLWTIESKTSSGFVINSNADTALTSDVDWVAILRGES